MIELEKRKEQAKTKKEKQEIQNKILAEQKAYELK